MNLLPLAMFGLTLGGMTPAIAEQSVAFNNVFILNQERFTLSDKIFVTQDNDGYSTAIEGPIWDEESRCIGGGFTPRLGIIGNSIQGICIFGKGLDFFTLELKLGDQHRDTTWNIVAAKGRYNGMIGQGTAQVILLDGYKGLVLRETRFIGTVSFDYETK